MVGAILHTRRAKLSHHVGDLKTGAPGRFQHDIRADLRGDNCFRREDGEARVRQHHGDIGVAQRGRNRQRGQRVGDAQAGVNDDRYAEFARSGENDLAARMVRRQGVNRGIEFQRAKAVAAHAAARLLPVVRLRHARTEIDHAVDHAGIRRRETRDAVVNRHDFQTLMRLRHDHPGVHAMRRQHCQQLRLGDLHPAR
jgi:hypothetical protein